MTAPHPSRAEAAATLHGAAPAALSSGRDRRVHGGAVIGLALAMGGLAGVVLGLWGSTWPWRGLVNLGAQCALLVILVATVAWRERSSRTRPRHARRIALSGIVSTGVLSLAVTTPVYLADVASPGPWVAVAAAVVVAAPGVLAGALIVRGPR